MSRRPLFIASVYAPLLLVVARLVAAPAFAPATQPAARQNVLRVACVGDSITAGFGTHDHAVSSYPSRLQQMLGARYDVRNFGVSGATALNAGNKPYAQTPAYPQALAFKPDIIVLMLGTNDSKHPGDGSLDADRAVNNWSHKAQFADDYGALLHAFRAANPDARIFAARPVPAFPGRGGINGKTIHDEIGPLIDQAAATVPGAAILDLNTALADAAGDFPDTVHPNEAGAAKLAAAVYHGITGQPAPPIADPRARLLLNRRVLVLGDSITQQGHYVTFLSYYLARLFPKDRTDIVSIGLASETVSGLSEGDHPFPRPCALDRLAPALDAVKPATVLACYGMNDGVYAPADAHRTAAFQEGMLTALRLIRLNAADPIVCTPPPFDPVPVASSQPADAADFSYKRPFAQYDSVLGQFADWERALPADETRAVVDFHAALATELVARRAADPAFAFTKDGIHPQLLGHLIMARTLLSSLGVELPPAPDLTVELARIQADPLYGLIKHQREVRSAGWLAYVGYTRGATVKTDSIDDTERTCAAIQVQIDDARR